MTRLMLGLAVVSLTTFGASIEAVRAAPNFQCSQRYFIAHAACSKNNSRELCDRVIGDRKAGCMRTGCWRTKTATRCGYSRL